MLIDSDTIFYWNARICLGGNPWTFYKFGSCANRKLFAIDNDYYCKLLKASQSAASL